MEPAPPPLIFAPARRRAARLRMAALQRRADAPRYLAQDMAEDVLDRIGFLRHAPARSLVVGDDAGVLAPALEAAGGAVVAADPLTLDEEVPYPFGGFDLIASLGTLDTLNDLVGALLHLRGALAPGGLMIASFVGAGSLPVLREIMLAADGERPAPRIHPAVDVRAGGQLLQRTGFANPVIDSRTLAISFASLHRLVADLRAQALGNVLARPGPVLGKAAQRRAKAAFDARKVNGRVTEELQIITLSGWKR